MGVYITLHLLAEIKMSVQVNDPQGPFGSFRDPSHHRDGRRVIAAYHGEEDPPAHELCDLFFHQQEHGVPFFVKYISQVTEAQG